MNTPEFVQVFRSSQDFNSNFTVIVPFKFLKMKAPVNWPRILFITGVVALVVGALDPLEGSVVVGIGSVLTALALWLGNDRYRKLMLIFAGLIVTGVALLWYVSSLGGFDPKKEWWWLVVIGLYPVGWMGAIGLLIVRWVKGKGSSK